MNSLLDFSKFQLREAIKVRDQEILDFSIASMDIESIGVSLNIADSNNLGLL